jgi:hypothetical protein
MNVGGLPEGTPILCRRCGGAMNLLADSSVSCRYCGAHDQLPGDQLGRVLEIKNRLAMAESRTAQVRGFDATFAHVFEDPKAFLRVMGVYLVVGLFVLGYSVWGMIEFLPTLEKLDKNTVAELLLGQVMMPTIVLGFAFSLGFSLGVGRRHYRKRVRPLLIARPPAYPNAPFACRACGGNLPAARGAEVSCTYCRTLNLVPKELHGVQAAALLHEAEAARQQLSRAHGALMSISTKMRTALVVSGVMVLALGYGLPMVLMAVLKQQR